VPHSATQIFLNYWMNQDWLQESTLACLWHHFHLALDKIWTHGLPSCVKFAKTFALLANYYWNILWIRKIFIKRNAMKCDSQCFQFDWIQYINSFTLKKAKILILICSQNQCLAACCTYCCKKVLEYCIFKRLIQTITLRKLAD